MIRRLLSLCLLAPAGLCGPLHADFSTSLAPVASHYDQRETDETGLEINRETGYLQGLELAVGQRLTPHWDWQLTGRWQKGTVDYRGQTQAGAPLNTRTDIDSRHLGLESGFHFPAWPTRFSGALYRYQRQRDIRASARSLSLREQYRGWELALTAKHPLIIERLWLDASALYRFDNHLTTDLSAAGYPHVRLGLPRGWGGRAGMRWRLMASDRWQGELAWHYEYRKTPRSNSARIRAETGAVLAVTQPETRLRQWFLGFSLSWHPK